MLSIKFSAGFLLLPDLFFPSSVCQASPAPTLAACLFCQEGMESSLMFWILRGILELLEVSHSFLWFGVNSSAGCGSREENLSAVPVVASKHERALDVKSFWAARAGDILSGTLSDQNQQQSISKNWKLLPQGSALFYECTFKRGTLLTNLNFQVMI